MSIEVMKQALEALEKCAVTIDWEWGDCRELEEMRQTGQYTDETTPAITALRAALAEPNRAEKMRAAGYTRRPTLRELAYSQTTHWEGCEAVHPECKKPEQAEQAQQYVMENAQGDLERISLVQTGVGIGKPEQEPVATWENHFGMKEWQVHALRAGWSITPPQRKPLSESELEALWDKAVDRMEHFCSQYWDFARAIERAHGIGGGE